MAVTCAVVVSITSLLTNLPTMEEMVVSGPADTTVLEEADIPPHSHNNNNHHCVIHVHGLHHSGTGFTRQVLYDSLGGDALVTKHQDTRASQDEGQHLQNIYPNFQKRLVQPKLCGLPPKQAPTVPAIGCLYYCPPLTENRTITSHDSSQDLFTQWSSRWDMAKPFLLQKTPTMDVLLLEQLKIQPTVHVIVMRQPMSWKRVLPLWYPKQLQQNQMYLPKVWWNVWTFYS